MIKVVPNSNGIRIIALRTGTEGQASWGRPFSGPAKIGLFVSAQFLTIAQLNTKSCKSK